MNKNMRALITVAVLGVSATAAFAATTLVFSAMPSESERREAATRALVTLVTERVDIAAEEVTRTGQWLTTDYMYFCADAAEPQAAAGWVVEPLEDEGCYEVMSAETAERLVQMREEQREHEALEPVRYVLGDAYQSLASVVGDPNVYVAVLPAYEVNRLMRDPEFTKRAEDAGLTPVLIDRVEEVIVDADRNHSGQPMLGILFDLSGTEPAS